MKTKLVLQNWQLLLKRREKLNPPNRNIPDTLKLSPTGEWLITFNMSSDILKYNELLDAIAYLDRVVTLCSDEIDKKFKRNI